MSPADRFRIHSESKFTRFPTFRAAGVRIPSRSPDVSPLERSVWGTVQLLEQFSGILREIGTTPEIDGFDTTITTVTLPVGYSNSDGSDHCPDRTVGTGLACYSWNAGPVGIGADPQTSTRRNPSVVSWTGRKSPVGTTARKSVPSDDLRDRSKPERTSVPVFERRTAT